MSVPKLCRLRGRGERGSARAPRGRCGPARAGARSGSPRSGSRARGGRRSAARTPSGSDSSSRCRIERQAPMFCGSSCAQTTSSRCGYDGDELGGLRRPGTGRAARAARRRPRSAPARALVADDVVVELPGAEHEPADALACPARRVVEHRRNAPSARSAERRRRLLQAQQALRRHHDERPRGRVERLAAQQVEVLRRGRAVGDADVVLRGELEEPLEPRARVLRAVALVAVREQQRQPRRLRPTSRGRRR